MKNKQIAFCFFLFIASTFSFAKESIDSIRIVGFDRNVCDDISRQKFLRFVKNMSDYETDRSTLSYEDSLLVAAWDLVDTTITNRKEIKLLISNIKKLKVVEKLHYNTMQYVENANYVKEKDVITWTPVYYSDYKLLLFLFVKDQVSFIWVDNCYLEQGYFRYLLNLDYKRLLGKYTHLYDLEIIDSK